MSDDSSASGSGSSPHYQPTSATAKSDPISTVLAAVPIAFIILGSGVLAYYVHRVQRLIADMEERGTVKERRNAVEKPTPKRAASAPIANTALLPSLQTQPIFAPSASGGRNLAGRNASQVSGTFVAAPEHREAQAALHAVRLSHLSQPPTRGADWSVRE